MINERWQRNAKGSMTSSFNQAGSVIGKDIKQSVIEYKEVEVVDPVKKPLINNMTTAADEIPKTYSKMEGTLELGSPIINVVPADIDDNFNSIVNKNSIIDHVGSANNFVKDEFESQFRVFLRL